MSPSALAAVPSSLCDPVLDSDVSGFRVSGLRAFCRVLGFGVLPIRV